MEPHEYTSLILYYGRERFFHMMQTYALDALAKYPGHKPFRLYNGLALCLGNRIQEAIRELHPLQSDADISMGVLLALIYAHRRCKVIDKEAILDCDARLKEERKRLSANGAYSAAVFLYQSGKVEKAREYADRALRLDRNNTDAAVLKGWCDVAVGKFGPNTLALFEGRTTVGGGGRRNIDAMLGQARYHQLNGDFEAALMVINRLAVAYTQLNVPLIEKMRTQLANWNWEHALETAQRILALDASNVEALRCRALIQLSRDGNANEAVRTLRQLFEAVGKLEPANAGLNAGIAAMFARICGRNADVLSITYAHAERAQQLATATAEYTTELGYQSLMLGRLRDATRLFRTASKLDDSSVDALCGLTLCQLAETGPSEQVRQQIEFLVEVQGAQRTPMLLFMSARLRQAPADENVATLIRASEIHFKNLTTTLFGIEYLRKFDPDFLLQLVDELLHHAPVQTAMVWSTTTNAVSSTFDTDEYYMSGGTDGSNGTAASVADSVHLSLRHSLNILDAICKACPGLLPAVYRLARTQFLCGDIVAATSTLHRLLHELDATYTEAHLLHAHIHIRQRNFDRAAQQLDVCLAHDFHVRELPLYHLLCGICLRQQQQPQAALKSFESAGALLSAASATGSVAALPVVDRVTLCLELAGTYEELGRTADAEVAVRRGVLEFANTPEEGRLVLASADLALQLGRTQEAIDTLKQILPGQPYYVHTKTKLAMVYLQRQRNRLAFTRCFRELVDESPGARSYLMLGNAHMTIQEPDEAINAFREAYNLDPSNSYLASKLGRAYVKTHQYGKAIKYYTEASRHVHNAALKLDLAELYMKLKQYSNAEQTLLDTLEIEASGKAAGNDQAEDIVRLQLRTKQLLLLARIRERSGNVQLSLATLTEARDNQYRVQQRTSLESGTASGTHDQHQIMAKICYSMAEQANSLRDYRQAIDHCKQALQNARDDLATLTMLARLYTQNDQNDECQLICERILQVEPNNEAASVMMADMSFRKMDFEGASYHFSQLLLAQPTYWTALTRLIEIMRRSATLSDAVPFLEQAEQNCAAPNAEAGLNYCRGLYEWYTGNPNGALRHFNSARRDPEWGRQSIFNMIDICLNPDGDLPNEKHLDDVTTDGGNTVRNDSRSMAVSTSERLLNELKPRTSGIGMMGTVGATNNSDEAVNHQLLGCFLTLAGRQRMAIEELLPQLTQLAADDAYREHVGPVYALAAVHVVLRQSQRARNQLKRVATRRWTFEDAEYLERCWLLLADLYLQAGKTDMVLELLDRVRLHNKSCGKAFELAGQCSEKTQMYALAATNYAQAWRLMGSVRPTIGYRLAFNYMKLKRYADAIDICQQVLKLHPEFTSIRKDVLDKCRNNLRG